MSPRAALRAYLRISELTVICDLVTMDGEIYTGLQNSTLTRVAINAHPSRSRVRATGRPPAWYLGLRHNECGSDGLVGPLETNTDTLY